jgi:hypothetical protein
MGWDRTAVSAALAEVLAAIDPTVSVFASAPETFNAPAYVVAYPRLVLYANPTFGTDTATVPVMVGVGHLEADRADAMLADAKAAIEADVSLGGVVQTVRVTEQSGWRRLNVAGAEILAADLVCDIRTSRKGNATWQTTNQATGRP